MITTAKRLDGIGEYYFSQKLREIDELNRQGKQVINLGIGSPDLPPHPEVIATLHAESSKPNVHAYQGYKGSPVLRKAMGDWYRQWYGVDLNPDTEILPLIGSKEGIMHICMTFLNEGDGALVPNPGYPTYRSAVKLAGATCIDYTLNEENNWEPDFEEIEMLVKNYNGNVSGVEHENTTNGNSNLPISEPVAQRAFPDGGGRGEAVGQKGAIKLLWLNYPHMPVGKLPSTALFEKMVAFARNHNLLICHDNPYSFILNDNPVSLLGIAGAKDCVIELNSLSKSHNMAGWRVGMLCGAKERIDEVLRFKSNMDSGMFLPLQLAAAKALSLDKSWYDEVNAVYRRRREKVYALLDALGCTYDTGQVGMFVWAKIPATYASGFALSDEVLQHAAVFITPGGIFGSAGNGFVRVSLCSTEEKFDESIRRIKAHLLQEKV